ncbi:uncharacterized protein LOC123891033 [Trifolium pratense]|uniref:uncharacterized protein LOC123891033 n=1 Tax=Trifolium pratense TaxID=57577 RepID=UPI001E697490|nr:uncharacterized protein LOC123891033 [Trifolium pratense]
MDYTFNKTLLVILSLSSLLLSSNAVPSTRVIDLISTSVPAAAPKSSFVDFTSTRFPAKAPSSIDFISTSSPAETPSSVDFISKSFPAVDASNSHVGNIVSKIATNVAKVATKVDPEILKICNEGGDKTVRCIETLSKLFQGPFDVVKALEIEVNTTLSTVKTLVDTIVRLRNDPSTDKRAIDALDICRDQYDMMLDSINQAMEILPQQNFVDAYNNMCAVISYNSACQEGWDESPGVVRPWDVEPLIQSTVICVDILDNIVNNHKF